MTDIFNRHHKVVLAKPNADSQAAFYSLPYAAHLLTIDESMLRLCMQKLGLSPCITRHGIYISEQHIEAVSKEKWACAQVAGVLGHEA